MRKTLKTMNPREAREHYLHLVQERISKAHAFLDMAYEAAPKEIRKQAIREAKAKLDKAKAWSNPQPWHIPAARERLEKYGMGVAAAFLSAHGWDARSAHTVLFGY
jgi:hypothetical protein